MFKKYIAYVVFTSLQLEGQNILKQQSRINVEKELWVITEANSINPSLCLNLPLLLLSSLSCEVGFKVLNGFSLHNSTWQYTVHTSQCSFKLLATVFTQSANLTFLDMAMIFNLF